MKTDSIDVNSTTHEQHKFMTNLYSTETPRRLLNFSGTFLLSTIYNKCLTVAFAPRVVLC